VQGQGLSSEDSHGVIVGQGLAANLGVKPGDTVVLLATTPSGSINAVEGTVRGLFATVTKAYDDSAIRVPIVMARQLLRISGLHSYVLLLDKTENTDVVVKALRKRFHGQALEVIPWYRMADFYNKTAELFSRQVNVVRLIIAVIIVLSISNSMMMSVLERTSEIGTLTALGTRRSGILSLFLTEGVLLGILGGCLGLLLGYGAAQLISVIGIPMPPPPGMASGYTAEIMVTWPLALQAFALAVSTTLVASLFPAWKASRMNIVDSLRHSR
jgi:putative ABC transport system permease protein